MIEKKWKELMSRLEACRSMLTRYHDLMSVFAEMDDCLGDMAQTEVTLKSEDYGKHLLGVQDLIQKHTLSETDITTQTEWAKTLKTQAQKFVEEKHPDSAKITRKANELDAACGRLQMHSEHRLSMLKVPSV